MLNEERDLNEILRGIAQDLGTPCYVYFWEHIRERVGRLRSAFGNRFRISYAVKSNPHPGILRRMRSVVDALDVSSAGEVSRALEADWQPQKLSFTGPGKTSGELQTSVDAGIGEIVLESVEEAELVNRIAALAGRRQRVLMRISPRRVPRGFGLNMSGKPSQFGIDEEEIDAAVRSVRALPHVDLCGFHIYSGTQCLDAQALTENYEIFIEIFKRVCSAHRISPEKLIFGSGIGIPYYENDAPVELAAVADKTNRALEALKTDSAFAATELVLETGRYLVGEAGFYLTRVIRKKRSRGVDICICDGGMNHHLGAAGHLGSVVQRNYRMFKVAAAGNNCDREQAYTLVGPLCTTIDTLGRQVKFNGLEPGDVIAIRSSGAYGATASPIYFISHPAPREIIVESTRDSVRVENSIELGGRGMTFSAEAAH